MSLQSRTTESGFLLPSIHSLPPFFTQQPNPATLSTQTEHWIRLILAYARHKGLFHLGVENAEAQGGEWDEILRNPHINRRVLPAHLSAILASLVSQNLAFYDPPKQTRSVILNWRLPREWAEVLYGWASGTGQLNSILTLYEIQNPDLASELTGIPLPLLRQAIAVLVKTNRAQLIESAEGGGVRFFTPPARP